MDIRININTANEAFTGASGTEVARILRALAERLDGDQTSKGDLRPLMDANGNRCGEYKVNRR